MTQSSLVIPQLLDRAWRRKLAQTIADQFGVALGVAIGGAILLLLAGTQILDWYWLVVLFAGALGVGLWRTLRRLPSRYALAQQIDSGMHLHDAISTAWHFETSTRHAAEEVRSAQRLAAESAARTVDLPRVLPFAAPKALYAAAGLAAVAFGLFAIRYGITRSLDLKPSLVRIAFDTFFPNSTRAAADKKDDWRRNLEEELQKLGINVNSTDTKRDEMDPAANALTAGETPEPAAGNDADTAKTKASAVPNERESSEPGGSEKSERSAAGTDKSGSDQPPEGNDGSPQNGKPSAPKNAKENQGKNSSLMDKMRDAMSNLLNKLKMNNKQGESKENAQNSQGSQSQEKGQGEKGQMAGKQQANGGEQQQDDQGQQQANGNPQQGSKNKSGDRSSSEKASQDAKSGIGKQDGDKSAREAEQMAAMGKISEILGKRAKDMSGEIMVEVSGGKQQLKTQYSSKSAAHAEAGGEINRDEVPLEYQEYVQQYFEQIRKSAPAKKPAGAQN